MITKLTILTSLIIFSLIAITPLSFAAEPYVSGSVVTSDEYPPWDRYIDVNGLRILGAPDIGGSVGVSDEFMEKIARTVHLLLDPDAPGIDPAAQIAAMSGMANNCSREGGYPQGLDSNQYGLTLQRTFGDNNPPTIFYSVIDDIDENHTGTSSFAEKPRWRDFVFQYNSGIDKNGQITEVLEHLLHTFSHFAFPVAYPVDLNIQTSEGPLWEAMQEAIANGVYDISDYPSDNDNEVAALLMQEYSYLLIYAEWDYITKYISGGSLAPEWADNSRTPAGVAANNPLGHALYQNYLSKIVAKPSSSILDEMYAVDGASGYTATSTGRGSVELVDCTVESSSSSSEIPVWIKNNAGWWADGQIDDGSFISGIQWLISNGIMKLTQETADPEVKPLDLTISSPPKYEKYFAKYVDVFGVPIYATKSSSDYKVLHAANVLAQYLDNDADGIPDNPLVVEKLKATNSAIPMFLNTWESNTGTTLWDDFGEEDLNCWTELTADETDPVFTRHMNDIGTKRFDFALEEIFHMITQCGYAEAYPEIFGEYQGSLIAEYMDNARGGYYEWVPPKYSTTAWYTYHDNSCEYNCMITEYFYWSMSSILGAHENRGDIIYWEWRLNTAEKVMETDPGIYNLLTDPQYKLPTILPDGNHQG